ILRATLENQGLLGSAVSGNYFSMLGVDMAIGRPIQPEDAAVPGQGAVIVLSHQVWQRQFGADAGIVGKKGRVNGYPFDVIGVMRLEFHDPMGSMKVVYDVPISFWIPLTVRSRVKAGDDLFGPAQPAVVEVMMRLQPGVQPKQAESFLLPLARRAIA